MRHVRDMWEAAQTESEPLKLTDAAVGGLLVFYREYTVHQKTVTVPGHIGIITTLGYRPTFIHASTVTGKVEERPLRRPLEQLQTVLGYIAITPARSLIA